MTAVDNSNNLGKYQNIFEHNPHYNNGSNTDILIQNLDDTILVNAVTQETANIPNSQKTDTNKRILFKEYRKELVKLKNNSKYKTSLRILKENFYYHWYGFSDGLKEGAVKSIQKTISEKVDQEQYGEFFEATFFETLKRFELNYSRYDINKPYVLFTHRGTDGYFAQNISKEILFKNTGLMCALFQKSFEELELKILLSKEIKNEPYTFFGKVELVQESNEILIQKIQN